jgi:regulator of RNase E activity RraA
MNHEHSSEAFLELIRRELYTAVVEDIMDSIGLRHQFLPPQIKPLRNDMIIVGRSMPVLEADVFTEAHDAASNSVMSRPFRLMLQALDDLRPDEVYVCTGASPEYALWGELMSLSLTNTSTLARSSGFHVAPLSMPSSPQGRVLSP